MNNEKMNQIIDEAHENYRAKSKLSQIPTDLTKEEFVELCKNDTTFSVYWGLSIEERELSLDERIILAGYDYENRGGIGWNMLKESVDLDNSIHRKLITITYNNEKTEIYE